VLIRQGSARTVDVDRRLACILAAVAGALNTAAFKAVGFFAANMTGNVSALSDHIGLGQWLIGAFYLLIVVTFISGAVVSTQLINAGRRHGIRRIYAFSILSEAILMALLGGVELILSSGQRGPVLVLGLSFLMGLQNATVTHISDARVRTTHISGMATDLGIELSMLFDIASGRETRADAASYRSKFRLHSQTVLSFLGGGVVGVIAYQAIGNLILFAVAAVLVVIALPGLLRTRTLRAWRD
jgi:uncharacterized membrane protein YoaK (UPF0700 family)